MGVSMAIRRKRVPQAVDRAVSSLPGVTVSSTEAQNEFGRVLDQAARDELVVITRHDVPRAVLMSVSRYQALLGAQETRLGELTARFDVLLEEMQRPDVQAATLRGFRATPKEMGQAAVAAARRAKA